MQRLSQKKQDHPKEAVTVDGYTAFLGCPIATPEVATILSYSPPPEPPRRSPQLQAAREARWAEVRAESIRRRIAQAKPFQVGH